MTVHRLPVVIRRMLEVVTVISTARGIFGGNARLNNWRVTCTRGARGARFLTGSESSSGGLQVRFHKAMMGTDSTHRPYFHVKLLLDRPVWPPEAQLARQAFAGRPLITVIYLDPRNLGSVRYIRSAAFFANTFTTLPASRPHRSHL